MYSSTATYPDTDSPTAVRYGDRAEWSEIEDIAQWMLKMVRKTAYEWDIKLCREWFDHLQSILLTLADYYSATLFKPKIKRL
jgi:hypothetical protein